MMDDKLKESISALMDDEVNELELHRILSQSADEEVFETWQRYHRVRDVLTRDIHTGFQVDVSKAVSLAIENDAVGDAGYEAGIDDHSAMGSEITITSAYSVDKSDSKDNVFSQKPAKPYFAAKGLFALAASVAFAFFFILQSDRVNLSTVSSPELASREYLDTNNFVVASNTQLAANTSMIRQPKMIVNMTDIQVKRFNQYLLRHAEHMIKDTQSGFMPLARVASVNAVGI